MSGQPSLTMLLLVNQPCFIDWSFAFAFFLFFLICLTHTHTRGKRRQPTLFCFFFFYSYDYVTFPNASQHINFKGSRYSRDDSGGRIFKCWSPEGRQNKMICCVCAEEMNVSLAQKGSLFGYLDPFLCPWQPPVQLPKWLKGYISCSLIGQGLG